MAADLTNIQTLVQQAASMVERLDKGILVDVQSTESLILRAKTALLQITQSSGNNNMSGGAIGYTGSSPTMTTSHSITVKRAESLLAECNSLMSSVDRAKKRSAKELHARVQREQLLGSRAGGGAYNRADDNDASLLSREEQSLKHSRTRVRNMIEESSAVLSALRGQGTQLSGTNQKLGELLETLGVSNQTILSIVRTNRVDSWIVYTGIVLMLILMWYLWFY